MDKIKEELEVYRTVSGITGDIFFKYDIKNDSMHFYSNGSEYMKYGSVVKDYVRLLKAKSFNHNDEGTKMFLNVLTTGEPGFFECSALISNHLGMEKMYSITGKTLYDDNNEPAYVVGRMKDISVLNSNFGSDIREKHTDKVTGVLTKTGIKRKFTKLCEDMKGAYGAFLVLSIDDLKKKCDAHPEISADTVIINVAQCIKREFYFDVTIGKHKPDEFYVIYHGIEPRARFIPKLEELKRHISNIKVSDTQDTVLTVSGGVFCGPFLAGEEYAIREKAHMALSAAKYSGKNNIVVYSPELEKIYNKNTEFEEEYFTVKFDHRLVEKTFDIMAESGDVNEAVELIINTIGTKYRLERIAVQELDQSNHRVSVSYNWIDERNTALKAKLARETAIDYDYFESMLDEHDIIIVPDTSKLKVNDTYKTRIHNIGLKSIVHCRFNSEHNIKGTVSFESYSSVRDWTDAEIRTFRFITKLISLYVINIRSYKEMLEENENMEIYDPVTGLYKYNEFVHQCQQYIKENPDRQLAIICTSMKDFPEVNKVYDYETGDEVLKEYTKIFTTGENRFILGSRINADNFVALVNLFDLRGSKVSEAAFDRLTQEFENSYKKWCPDLNLEIKAGVCPVYEYGIPVTEYINQAFKARDSIMLNDDVKMMMV